MAQKPRIDLNIASNAGTIAKNFRDLAQAITRVNKLRNAINAKGEKNKPLSFDIDFKQISQLEKVAESIKTSLGSLAAEGDKVEGAMSEMLNSDPTKSKAVTSIAALNVLLEQTRTLINSLDNKTVEINGNNTGLVKTVNASLSQLKKLNKKVTVDIDMQTGTKGDSYRSLWKNYANAAQKAMKSSKKFAEFAKGDTFKIPSYSKDYKAFFEEYNKATDIEGKMSVLAKHFKGNHAFGQLIDAINNNTIDKLGIKGKNFDKVVDAVRPFADMTRLLDYKSNGKNGKLKPHTVKIKGDISGLKTAIGEARKLLNGLPTKTVKIEGQVTANGGGGDRQEKPLNGNEEYDAVRSEKPEKASKRKIVDQAQLIMEGDDEAALEKKTLNWNKEYDAVWSGKPEKVSKQRQRIRSLIEAYNDGQWDGTEEQLQKLQFRNMGLELIATAAKNNLTVEKQHQLDLIKRDNDAAALEQKTSAVEDKYRGATVNALYDERENLIKQLQEIQAKTKIATTTADKYNEACQKELELLKRINEIEDHPMTSFPASGMTSKLNNKLGAKERHDAFMATQEAIKKQRDAGEVRRLEREDQRLQKQKQKEKDLANQNKNNVSLADKWYNDEQLRMKDNSKYHKDAWNEIVATEKQAAKDLANQNKNNVSLADKWYNDEQLRIKNNSKYHKDAWNEIVAAEKQATKEFDKQQEAVNKLLGKLDKLKKDYQLAVESQTRPSDRQALKNDYEEAEIFKALATYGVNPIARGYYRQWNIGNRNRLNELIPENTKANDHTQRLLTIQGQYNEEIARQNALLERGEMVTQKYVDNSVAKLEKLKREYEELGGDKEKLQISPFAGMSAKEINTRNSMRNLDAWKDQYFSTANEKVNVLTGSLERAYNLIRRNPGNVGIKKYIKETEVELKKAQREADIINRKMKLLNPDNLTKGWEHKLRWIGGAFGFYETYDFLGRAGETIKEFEENMANLRTVMPSLGEPLSIDPIEALKNNRSIDKEMQKATYEDQQRQMINIGAKYGVSNSDIIESARLWGRMYKERETVNLLTTQSAKLAVADNFSMEESTKAVEAAMFQFGMQAHSTAEALAYSNRIIDVYTKLSHNAGVTAQDLAAAVERSGSVAHQAGMSFEFLNALIAQATRSTALSGSAIGTMLKTFIASIRSDKAVEELDKIGIKVKEVGEDGVERFRDIQQVILDIAIQAKYTNNDIQKTLLAISGGRRKLAA